MSLEKTSFWRRTLLIVRAHWLVNVICLDYKPYRHIIRINSCQITTLWHNKPLSDTVYINIWLKMETITIDQQVVFVIHRNVFYLYPKKTLCTQYVIEDSSKRLLSLIIEFLGCLNTPPLNLRLSKDSSQTLSKQKCSLKMKLIVTVKTSLTKVYDYIELERRCSSKEEASAEVTQLKRNTAIPASVNMVAVLAQCSRKGYIPLNKCLFSHSAVHMVTWSFAKICSDAIFTVTPYRRIIKGTQKSV